MPKTGRALRGARRDERGAEREARTANGGREVVTCVALVALTFVVFVQVRHFDFVNWDDPGYVTDNANVQAGLSWANVRWALTTAHSPYWHPLTWLSHMLDVTLFGMDAGWHHVTSLVIHIASTLVLFAILVRTTRATAKSVFVAAIFAVHPLHVESVAWLAERKDVLSTFFLMVTIWMYVRYVERPRALRYAAVVGVYALALMSKPMVVTLPFVLLLLDIWPLGRLGRRQGLRHVLVEKLPLLALAIGVSVSTLLIQTNVGAVAGLNALPIGARVTNALVGCMTYLWKTIWPAHLAAFYPLRGYPAWVPALAGVALVALTALACQQRRERPYVFVGWWWFLITVAPVIGLLQSGEQATADRFMYVPLIGLSVIAAWGASTLPGLKTRPTSTRGPSVGGTRVPSVVGRVLRPGTLGVAIVLAYAAVAHAQATYWSDSLTLWRHAAAVTEGNYVAYEKIGEALRDRGQLDEAAASYEQALKVAPANSPVYVAAIENDVGLVRERQGRFDEAERHFGEAARLDPRFAEAQNNYANALAAEGKYDDAIEHYHAALAIQPSFAESLIGLGGSLVREARPAEAEAQYREALRLNPNLAQAHNGLGTAFTLQHRDEEAMTEFNRALDLKPDLPSAHLNIAIVLLRRGDTQGARRHLETALSIDPGYEPARNVLARIR